MAQTWPAMALAFFLTALLIRLCRQVAVRWNLVDSPGGRKAHERPTPVIGGLAILLGFAVATPLAHDAQLNVAGWSSLIVLVITGLIDDARGLGNWPKLLIQFIAAGVAILVGGVLLHDLGSWPSGAIMALGVAAIPLTWFAMVGFINAVNMLDGLDGLAGGVVTVMLLWLAFAAGLAGATSTAQLCLILAAAVIGFLLHNMRTPWRHRASVFLGDAGSLALGFAVAWLAIEVSQLPNRVISPFGLAWVLVLPVMDTVSLMMRRLMRGKNPFHADRNHLHHILGRAGFSVGQSTAVLMVASAVLGGFGVLGSLIGVPDVVLGVALLSIVFGHYLFVRYAWRSTRALKRILASRPPSSFPDQLAAGGLYVGTAGVSFAATPMILLGYVLVLVATVPIVRSFFLDVIGLWQGRVAIALAAWLAVALISGPTSSWVHAFPLLGISGLLALPIGWWLARLYWHSAALVAVLVFCTLLAFSGAVEWPMLESGLIQTSAHWGKPPSGGLLLALVLMPLLVTAATGLSLFRQRWRARAMFVLSLVLVVIALLFLLGTESRTAIFSALAGLIFIIIAAAAHGVGNRLWAGIAGGAVTLVLFTVLLASVFKPSDVSLKQEYLQPVQSAMLYIAGAPELARSNYPQVAERLDDWREAWAVVAERPLVGHGLLRVSGEGLPDSQHSAYAMLGLVGGWVAIGLFVLLIFGAIRGVNFASHGRHWPLAHVIAAYGAIGVLVAFLFVSPLVTALVGVVLLNGVLALGVAGALSACRQA
mgnify:CR=1 FL=1